jgi:hypothetical protein
LVNGIKFIPIDKSQITPLYLKKVEANLLLYYQWVIGISLSQYQSDPIKQPPQQLNNLSISMSVVPLRC